MTLALDDDLWWGVGNPDDVRAGDTIVSIIGNRYTAAPIRGVTGSTMCRNPDDPDHAFILDWDRFDHALRHRPRPDGPRPPRRLDEWRPGRTCPGCGREDGWRNDGVLRLNGDATPALWRLAWRCRCGRTLATTMRDAA